MTTLRPSMQHHRSALIGAGLALMLLLGACGNDGGSEQATGNTAEPPQRSEPGSEGDPTPGEITDGNEAEEPPPGQALDPVDSSTLNPVAGDWILQTLVISDDIAIGFAAESTPTLSIEGTIFQAFGGCQTLNGTADYNIDGDSFSARIGPLSELGPICEDDGPAEAEFFKALEGATTFTAEPGVLVLSDGAEAPTTMRFVTSAKLQEAPGTEPDDLDEGSAPAEDIAESYVGLTLEDAQALAAETGQAFRVVHLDGEDLMGTADFSPDRINAKVIDGIVTETYRG